MQHWWLETKMSKTVSRVTLGCLIGLPLYLSLKLTHFAQAEKQAISGLLPCRFQAASHFTASLSPQLLHYSTSCPEEYKADHLLLTASSPYSQLDYPP